MCLLLRPLGFILIFVNGSARSPQGKAEVRFLRKTDQSYAGRPGEVSVWQTVRSGHRRCAKPFLPPSSKRSRLQPDTEGLAGWFVTGRVRSKLPPCSCVWTRLGQGHHCLLPWLLLSSGNTPKAIPTESATQVLAGCWWRSWGRGRDPSSALAQ